MPAGHDSGRVRHRERRTTSGMVLGYHRREGHFVKSVAKAVAVGVARAMVFPAACLAGFGRWHEPYLFFAQAAAMIPGLPGSYLRVAYYRFTLDSAGRDCQIGFGSYFAHASASFGDRVGIGAYCVLGQVDIGEGTQLASHIQIVSGKKQHVRDDDGKLTDEGRSFRRISIGAHCWIGAGAIVMADVGAKSTLGAGSVATQDVPEGVRYAGNPARDSSLMVKPHS
jgi:acetyltransferase-like isoleucine patch superfamily enzyme